MNYRHIFHAGNFADVFKHITLVALLQSLLRKDTAFCYLDTHAGIGKYDFSAEAAQKTKEFEEGIFKILSQANPPALIKTYLDCVKTLNTSEPLRFYPGSPLIAQHFLREQDRMVLSELHPEDYQTLRHLFAKDRRVAVHHQNGYQALKAFLPPKERRGIILIDPPYEVTDEYTQLLDALAMALKRFETGVYAIWYPIKTRTASEQFVKKLQAQITRPTLVAEFSIYPDDVPMQLNGSGMLIVNPPWQLKETLEVALEWLATCYESGKFRVFYESA